MVMLRRMDGAGALGRRTADGEAAARLARRALGWAALAGAMFLLCGARPGAAGRTAPFAMAFLSAALLAGRGTGALLAGCLAGAINGPLRDYDLALPIGAAIALGGSLVWDAAKPALERTMRGQNGLGRRLHGLRDRLTGRHDATSLAPNRLARSPNDAAACAALAGASVLLPGLLLPGGELTAPAALEVTAASLAAVAAAPFLRAALADGRALNPDSRAGLGLLLGALAMGLPRLSVPVAVWAGGTLVLLMFPGGALAGTALGGALALAAGEPRLCALLAAGGASAQLSQGWTKPARSALACGAMFAAGLAMKLSPAILAGALLPSLTLLPMPEEWARFFLLLSCSPDDPRRRAETARRGAARRVRALAAALSEAAEASEPLVVTRQVLEALAGELAHPHRPRRPRLRAEWGAACASQRAGAISGDSHLVAGIDGHRLLALICDGMGSGEAAARESWRAARLVGRLLRAGATLPLALAAANALLMDRFGGDMFATADAMVVNLSSGEAAFGKQAACPTLILRNGAVLRVDGGRLPLGILEEARPRISHARLRPGDTVLMASDGAFDALEEAAMENLLLDHAGLEPTQIAGRILMEAERVNGIRDDRTVLCLRIVRREE